jgi:hypothetical protein
MPISTAEVRTKVFIAEPAWRRDCQARLNFFFSKSVPPTMARMKPVSGSIATRAPAGLQPP